MPEPGVTSIRLPPPSTGMLSWTKGRAMPNEIEELRARVQRLEDHIAILQTFSQYSHARDYYRPAEYVRAFADDGVFELRDQDGSVRHREHGTGELLAYLDTCPHPPDVYDKHLLAQPLITEMSDTEAKVESFWIFLTDRGAGPQIVAYGRYQDHLVNDAGSWRLKERHGQLESNSMT